MITFPEPDPGYLVRKLDGGNWECTKWGCETAPLAVYTIRDRGRNTWRCNGPSRKCHAGGCKHVQLVKYAIKHPDRDPYAMLMFEDGE